MWRNVIILKENKIFIIPNKMSVTCDACKFNFGSHTKFAEKDEF